MSEKNAAYTSSDENPEWTVLYHAPGIFKGRGEFLRLMLEDAQVSYVNTAEGLYGPNGMMDAFRGSPEAIAVGVPFPVVFPPAIWHRPKDQKEEVLINQVGACMVYLGEMLGYAPATAAERARADCVMLNALDYLPEGRASNAMSYKNQGDKVSKEFWQRMKTFLHHFNKVIVQNKHNNKTNGGESFKHPVAGGVAVTYADFALFHVLDATAFQFNSEHYNHTWDNLNLPALKEYYQWMKYRPNLQAYYYSDRCARTSLLFSKSLTIRLFTY
jgi:glutathione S-transferase